MWTAAASGPARRVRLAPGTRVTPRSAPPTAAWPLPPATPGNATAPGGGVPQDDGDGRERGHVRATTPLGRRGPPADVVAAVKFLLAGTDYVTGTVLVIDGGRLIR